jgi:exodeoxyribonuclease III
MLVSMDIATWNVNSLKVRLPHVLEWLVANPVDILCLQETKLVDGKFPQAELQAAGYGVFFTGQPTYNGVAILYRIAAFAGSSDVAIESVYPKLLADRLPDFVDEQKRLIAVEFDQLIAICGYFPNGQALDSDKFQYKLAWIDSLHRWVAQLRTQDKPLVLAGDFNIAPDDRDVHDPLLWAGQLHCSPQERERFFGLVDLGLIDTFRAFEQPPKLYSWWDYRQLGFRRNAGLRIDHILIDERLKPRLSACRIDKEPRRKEQPSDHAPVIARLV